MNLSLQQVCRMLTVPELSPDAQVSGWSIDTRTLEAGDIYFALHGEVHDGHKFVEQAFAKGAVAAVVDRPMEGATLQVPDTLKALQQLATWARGNWGGQVIGVTGSAGKTSTKDAIAHLTGAAKTIGNFNNHIGVPLSILRIPDEAGVAVLEMGMNHAGEIRALCAIAKPDIGVVTNVGHAHLEFFDSIEGIALAKRELIESLPADGTAVLNADDPRVLAFRDVHRGRTVTYGFAAFADIRAEQIDATHFRCSGVVFETNLPGRHAVSNILAGIAVASVIGLAPGDLTEAVRTLTPGKMRGERIEFDGLTILNDSYNSNPAAARSMIDVLRDTPARRRIAVMGEMLELGDGTEPLHRELGKYIAERGIEVVIAIRGAARFVVDAAHEAGMSGSAAYFFNSPEEAGDFLRNFTREGDAILFKGSRGVQVERALASLMQAEKAEA